MRLTMYVQSHTWESGKHLAGILAGQPARILLARRTAQDFQPWKSGLSAQYLQGLQIKLEQLHVESNNEQ